MMGLEDYSKEHKKAWEFDAYDFWVRTAGTPKERAAKEKAEREKAEKERRARERAEREKAKRERLAKEKAERERIAKEKAEKEKAEKERAEKERIERQQMQARANSKKTCKGCGKLFVPKAEDNNLCPECLADRAKMLDGILAASLGDALERKEPSKGAAPVEGYDKVALLGKGGMGEVWKVRERSTGKVLALKTMLPQVAADEKGKRMFLREAFL